MIKKFNEFSNEVNEQQIIDDIIGGINESSFDFNNVLNKVKNYARKGVLTAAILTSLLATKGFSQTQKDQIKSASGIELNTATSTSSTISPSMREDWNNFIDWMAKEYPQGVSDKGADPTPNIISAYKKINPKTTISQTNVASFQKDLLQYNAKWKTLQANYHDKGDYISKPSAIDSRIGSKTSKIKFPDVKIGGTDYKTDIDAAVKAANTSKDNDVYIDPNLTTAQRFQQNQARRIKGQALVTNAEHRADSIKNASKGAN